MNNGVTEETYNKSTEIIRNNGKIVAIKCEDMILFGERDNKNRELMTYIEKNNLRPVITSDWEFFKFLFQYIK